MSLDAVYRRTPAGDAALRSVDDAISVDYRRILCLLEGDTHANVIRGRLRRFPDQLITDWLAELADLGFVESSSAAEAYDLDFEPLDSRPRSALAARDDPEEAKRLEKEVRDADLALKDEGAYLSTARLRNRAPVSKSPGKTVVLIVEDDPDQAALGDLRVSMAGYGVRLARNKRELIEDFAKQPLPDLVLLDVVLPDGNGFDILAAMRNHPRFALLPVVMLTALAGPENIRRGIDLGADGYVTKPYSTALLIDTIQQVLGR